MPNNAVDAIGPAFQRMTQQLFKPFRFRQWLRFALVGVLAGEMGSGGGFSGRFPASFPSRGAQQLQGGGLPFGSGPLLVLAICSLVLLVLALGIALLYVSSRMRFVLFDSVVAGECRIREFWRRRGDVAFRYFIWQLLFALVAFIGFVLLVGAPVGFAYVMGWFSPPDQHVFQLVLGGIALLLVILAFIIAMSLIKVLVKDFVVPQMAFDGVTVGEGWSNLWGMMKREKGGYAGYAGMKFILALAAAVALGIVAIIIFLILLIPVGGVGVVTVLAGQAAGLSWNPMTVAIAVAAGIIVLLAILFIAAMISVPAIVFFPAYSIHFFADRYPALHLALHPPAPAPENG